MEDGGNEFKSLFALYNLSTFLTPATNRKVHFNAVKSLIKVDEIQHFDWSCYILERLCKDATKYNNETTQKKMLVDVCCCFKFCIFTDWNGKDKYKQRTNEEIATGSFGLGELDISIYPITTIAAKKSDDKMWCVSEAKTKKKKKFK